MTFSLSIMSNNCSRDKAGDTSELIFVFPTSNRSHSGPVSASRLALKRPGEALFESRTVFFFCASLAPPFTLKILLATYPYSGLLLPEIGEKPTRYGRTGIPLCLCQRRGRSSTLTSSTSFSKAYSTNYVFRR